MNTHFFAALLAACVSFATACGGDDPTDPVNNPDSGVVNPTVDSGYPPPSCEGVFCPERQMCQIGVCQPIPSSDCSMYNWLTEQVFTCTRDKTAVFVVENNMEPSTCVLRPPTEEEDPLYDGLDAEFGLNPGASHGVARNAHATVIDMNAVDKTFSVTHTPSGSRWECRIP